MLLKIFCQAKAEMSAFKEAIILALREGDYARYMSLAVSIEVKSLCCKSAAEFANNGLISILIFAFPFPSNGILTPTSLSQRAHLFI